MPRPRLILHIVPGDGWDAGGSVNYAAPSLSSEGFIHCSTPEQVLGPAHALFRGQGGLVLLCIDAHRLQAAVVYEDCYAAGETFPHIYGPIERDAVVAVVPFPPDANGAFTLPNEVDEVRASLG